MKIFKLALIIIFLLSLYLNLFSSNFDHSVYDEILKKHVENGLVDYKALKTNDAALDKYLKQLKQINSNEFENWSKDEKLALWINAYNAITIEGILRSYPIEYGGILDRIRFPKN
ncbi:DUF547 domain-containing protein, partial [candidate division KSB1 bacterium]|nr:DUF547 domain-containing protein [candidate division KSB1 bacterium]